MPLPPWTVELLRRSITDVARKASETETLEKLKSQATEILQDLPATAARSIDAVMRSAEAGKRTVEETVEKWTRKPGTIGIEMINASGVLLHENGCGVALSDAVIKAGVDVLRGDQLSASSTGEGLRRRIIALLPAGEDYAVAIANNFPAAMTAFSQLVQDRELIIHRSHATRLPSGQPLPEAFGTLLPVIQEVGSVGGADASDYDGHEIFCTIMADDGEKPVKFLDFGDRDAMQAVVLPVATFAATKTEAIPSAVALLQRGADFVLMPGNGVCGGPACGILVGRKEGLQTITDSPAWPALQASDAVQAMLAKALESMKSDTGSSPIQSLLDTSVENLNSRAERMSARLGGCDAIEMCRVTDRNAQLTNTGRWLIASRQLRVKHSMMSAVDWANKLRAEEPAIVVRVDGDEIVVDMRWFCASRDNVVAQRLGGEDAEKV